jgi:chromosome segregation protein
MRIRRLELTGFKSFKDKTVIHFDDGITGIVGPNGCGKSNVVDAFFWVMGEQNARHLRGQNMNDLIFSGADKAPPASWAEVTLVLEMPGDITGPAAAAGASASPVTLSTREVSITRKLYRTGECDYFMNKVPCRLRDIQELFMDTGVGSRGYSIIQQGQIAKIVQAKPEDRRTMIEEVAGIIKYKTRRKESTRKLEGTQQNLLRVTDVINELETQKRQMERQADKARKYKEWKERLQSIELHFSALKWEDFSARFHQLELEIEQLSMEDLALTTAREAAETQISQMRLELAQASSVAEEFQRKWMDAATTLNNTENDLKYSQKNLEDARLAFAQLEQDSGEQRVLVESLTSEYEALVLEAETINEQFAAADALRTEQEELASSRKREAEETESAAEEARAKLFTTGSELEKARSAAAFSEQRLSELASELERIALERLEREEFVAGARGERAVASERTELAKREAETLRTRSKEISEQISTKNRELHEQRRELGRVSSENGRLRATLNAMEEQKKRHEHSSKGVKSVFQDLLPQHAELQGNVKGTLADLLEVDAGLESAAEAALGRSLELVLTNDAAAQLKLGSGLKEGNLGRAAFADIARLAATANAPLAFEAPAELAFEVRGPLTQFVRLTDAEAAPVLTHLLANTIVVNTAAVASELSPKFPAHTFITTDGELFRGGWYMEGGDKSSVSGSYVGRNREIAELTEKVEQVAHQLEAMQLAITEAEAAISALETEKRATEDEHRNKQSEISGFVSEEATLNARLQEAERTLAKFLSDTARFESERERLEATGKEARVKIFALETERGALEVEVSRLATVLSDTRAAWEIAQQALMDARVKAANLQDQKNTFETRRRQNENALSQHRNRIESMLENARRRQAESEETAARIVELQARVENERATAVDAEATFRAARDRFDVLNNGVEEQRTVVQDHANRERQLKENLLQLRLEHQKVSGDRDSTAQHTLEHYGLVLGEYALQPETMEQVQLLRDGGEGVINEVKNEVTLLREKIRKLGDVNPAAVEEYDAVVIRYNDLSTQKADLERAMKDLQDTVDKINKVSKDRFERAFGETNEHFKRVFPVIFGGGHATLALTNPEDMLETGVDITAQPPGKKPQNINLLSGGEKTLTALSLLFSIFLVKPSPFCLLDEVDAPLDDANIGRFNALLREMSKRSQFIIITHNKRTMELNDKLYGVTMEDAGVSKMVSIQLTSAH